MKAHSPRPRTERRSVWMAEWSARLLDGNEGMLLLMTQGRSIQWVMNRRNSLSHVSAHRALQEPHKEAIQ
jgi:hypothetical protein